ncbi:molybdopterin-dependent oxidoreductase [Corallococcus llansteffanensis]|uniref:Molybdopterin-binding protein n=1 Tax=Corallococcus llansteffanensis TaxID=2316731 RepID=A0A3A8QHT9_9BACT|nr:molybdopterin-dependent oxidoreductase [Corallococcus llansteffanensis]RKH67478.1 molybdopterin-binding protein [Corallococcus llansteffanensis]
MSEFETRSRLLTRRRVLLGAAALTTSACDSSRPREGFLGVMERFNQHAQAALFHPGRLAPEEGVEQLTPPGDFPTYFISDTVPVAPAGWRLEVGGSVSRPRAFTLEELQQLPRTDYRIRHHCVEGWSAVASWHGVRLSDLARAVGADPRAGFVEFRSFDSGYFSSWDAASALHPQTVLAYGMNGQPLAPGHGAPLRLYAGVKLGYKMVKYLTQVSFLPEATGGTWEDRGYEWFAGV